MPTFYDPVTGRPYNLAMEQGPFSGRGGGVGSLPGGQTSQTRLGGIASLPQYARRSMFQANPSALNSPYGYDPQMRYKEGAGPRLAPGGMNQQMRYAEGGGQFMNASGQPANPSFQASGWMPSELMPGYSRGGGTGYGQRGRPSMAKNHRSKSGGRANVPLNWSYSGSTMPAGAGTGGYYPGTGGEAQMQVKQNAVGNFIQYARSMGAGERQIQQGVAAIMGGGMPGGGGGGGGNGQLSDLISEYQKAHDKANAANEARYRDILAGYQDRYSRSMANLAGMGEQEAKDIDEAAKHRAAALRQSLVARGLSNSTVMDNLEQGVERERVNDMGRLQERLRNQMIGFDTSLSGDTLGFMERREDTGPDLNQLLQLSQMLGGSGLAGGQVQQVPPLMAGAPIFMGGGSLFGDPLAGLVSGPMGYVRSNARPRVRAPRRPAPSAAPSASSGWGMDLPMGGIPDWAAFTV